jgi:RNA polymerase sigma-70 factor, ECF subfamily
MAKDSNPFTSNIPPHVDGRASVAAPSAQDAFWALWTECHAELLRCCRLWLRTSDPAEAEDALSSAMMHAFDRLPLVPPAHPRAWLFTVVKNFCLDLLRSPRAQRVDAAAWEQAAERMAQVEGEDLESTLVRKESDDKLHTLVGQLPDRLRTVLELVLAGYKYDEIGLDLGITATNVRKRAEEGRVHLRDMLLFGQMPPRTKSAPDASPMRSDAGRRADGHSMPGYRPPTYAHLVKTVDGTPLTEPIVCFVSHSDERLEQRSKTLEKYIAQHQGGHIKHLELAELYLSQGRWARSMELLREVLRHGQHPGLPLVRLAMMQHSLGDIGAAKHLLQQGVQAPMPQVMADFLLGTLSFCEGDLAAAERHWRGSLALNPHWQLPLQALVGLAIHRGELGAAAALLDLGLVDFPGDRVLHYWRCSLPAGPAVALQAARTAVRLFPEDPVAAMQLRRACVLSAVPAPMVGRAERRSRFETFDLDLKLLAAAKAGRMDLVAELLRRLPADTAFAKVWQDRLAAPLADAPPPSPWLYLAPVLPF